MIIHRSDSTLLIAFSCIQYLVQLAPLATLALSAEAGALASTTALVDLDNEHTTLDGVDKDVTGRKQEVAPGTDKTYSTLTGIVFRVDVKEGLNSNTLTGGVLLDGTNVMDPNTVAVVGLVSKTIDNVEVVVNTLLVGGEEVAGVLGVLEVRQIGNVSDRATRRSRAGLV